MRSSITCPAHGCRRGRVPLVAAAIALALGTVLGAQEQPPGDAEIELRAAQTAVAAARPAPPATLTFANRAIMDFRSSLLGRQPKERVVAAQFTLQQLVESGVTGPVTTRQVGPALVIEVAGRRVANVLPSDVDALTDDTQAGVARDAAARLRVALTEAAELHRPRQLAIASLQVLAATAVTALLLWLLWRARQAMNLRVHAAIARLQDNQLADAELLRSSRINEFMDRAVALFGTLIVAFICYAWLTFSLRRFPYTRPWGESLRGYLIDEVSGIGAAIVSALPGLFTVLIIALITRAVVRVVQVLFVAFEEGRVSIPWLYQETAVPTRKLVTVGLWLFAVAIAYPYLPGSDSEAFKGMSVFIGLVISLGSSGIVNQVMSGFTITYSRALRTGDVVKVGDVEGQVTQVGSLSTKIRTLTGEDVTIPNAVVVSQTITNYSRFDREGVFVSTEITIGYDVPWRQVEALLLLAAARSAGVRRDRAPFVRTAKLEDFYVRYRLLFCPERPEERRKTLATVHANILDAFNEYGVQITSPNYEADPERPKIVPRDRWFAAPARPSPADAPTIREVKIDVPLG